MYIHKYTYIYEYINIWARSEGVCKYTNSYVKTRCACYGILIQSASLKFNLSIHVIQREMKNFSLFINKYFKKALVYGQ